MKKVSFLAVCAFTVMSSLPALAAPSLEQAIHCPSRDTKFVARDHIRHPKEELSFFALNPNSHVIEIWPGGGYWTQIIAPYVNETGRYTVALGPEDKGNSAFNKMLAAHPDLQGKFNITQFDSEHLDFVPANSTDLVVTFRNLHNWMEADNAPEMLAAIYRVLKPGGILGVEDHRGHTDEPQDPRAADGYVRQPYAIALIEKAGFKLIGTSEINANPKDTAHWPKGVWTLPPTYALGDKDHDKYEAIGEGDNFVLKFQKIDKH